MISAGIVDLDSVSKLGESDGVHTDIGHKYGWSISNDICTWHNDEWPIDNNKHTLKVNDRIAVHVDTDKHTLHFTHNGLHVGKIYTNVIQTVVPAISLCDKQTITLVHNNTHTTQSSA
jgi:hypothetical protein